MKAKLGILIGTAVGAFVLAAPLAATTAGATASDVATCAGPSGTTGTDTIAGPVYGSLSAGYVGVLTNQGYAEANVNGTPVVKGDLGTASFKVAGDQSTPCVIVNGTQVTP